MTPTETLFAFVQKHYSVMLSEHRFWSDLAKELNSQIWGPLEFQNVLLELYSKHIKKDASLAKRIDPLFMSLCLQGIHPVRVFTAWTQNGIHDILDS